MKITLSELMSMERNALKQHWVEVFRQPVPIRCRDELMRQALGWKIQADAQGRFSGAQRRQINKKPGQVLAVGSRLIRVWQGETHQVMVLANGYSYAGKQWKSLSAIAREITGTPWSGPAFFGTKK